MLNFRKIVHELLFKVLESLKWKAFQASNLLGIVNEIKFEI